MSFVRARNNILHVYYLNIVTKKMSSLSTKLEDTPENREKAEQTAKKIDKKMWDMKYKIYVKDVPVLSEALDKYIRAKRITGKHHRTVVRKFIEVCRDKRIDKYKPEDFDKFYESLNVTDYSKEIHLRVMKGLFRYFRRMGII